jgi:membrane associated rhomboid family serine protease
MESQGTEAGTAPVCYRHPDRVTYLACTRCERPICGDCSIEAAVGQRCPTCVMEQGTQRVIRRPAQRGLAHRAPITMGILVVTVLAYIVASVVPGARSLVVLVPAAVLEGDWWRILSHSLGHGGFLHLGVNMYALYILGQGLEARLGRLPFISVWLFSAVAGGVAVTYLADPFSGTVGASGAVFGLFGIWLGSAWVQRRSRAGNAQLRSILSLLAINAFISLLPGISWQGHLGGLIGGVVAYGILRTVKDRSAAAMLLLGLAGILVFATQL